MSIRYRITPRASGVCLAMLALAACSSEVPTAPEQLGVSAARSRTTSTFVLSVTRSGTGTGSVTSSPAGLNCGPLSTTCSASFPSGTVVTLMASPGTQSEFGGWSGGCIGTTSSCSLTLSANQSVGAVFNAVAADAYEVTLTTGGNGTGTVLMSGGLVYSCADDCIASFPVGSSVTLQATAGDGSVFGGWSGACSGTNTTCTVTVNGPVMVSATFAVPVASSHVSIPAAYRLWGTKSWSVDIDVAAHATDPATLAGAVITVELSGGIKATKTCTTSSAGICLIPSGAISTRATSITFTVTNVSRSGYVYQPGLNHNLNPANLGATNQTVVTSNNSVTFYR